MCNNCLSYVDAINENNDSESCEGLHGFAFIDESSVKGLTDVILKFTEKNKLGFKHCRGQG
jgi:hypothetical protein